MVRLELDLHPDAASAGGVSGKIEVHVSGARSRGGVDEQRYSVALVNAAPEQVGAALRAAGAFVSELLAVRIEGVEAIPEAERVNARVLITVLNNAESLVTII